MEDDGGSNNGGGDDLDRKPAAVVDLTAAGRRTTSEDSAGSDALDNDMDDDDDDNWSRQVQTDETLTTNAAALLQEEMRSVLTEGGGSGVGGGTMTKSNLSNGSHRGGTGDGHDDDHNPITPPPCHPELSLKERLVLRERERRIETERARLKRQFALSNNDNADGGGMDGEGSEGGAGRGGGGGGSNREAGSATEGTLGEESTRAHPDPELQPDQEQLGFNMERFLRNSDTFDPHQSLQLGRGGGLTGGTAANNTSSRRRRQQQPALMERFLSDPVVVQPPPPPSSSSDHGRPPVNDGDGGKATAAVSDDGVQRTVSFDVEGHGSTDAIVARSGGSGGGGGRGGGGAGGVPSESLDSFGDGDNNEDEEAETNVSTNASIEVEAGDDVAREPLTPMTSMDVNASAAEEGGSRSSDGGGNGAPSSSSAGQQEQPRVLRLTEADMQEMAAIEEASIGNAPPLSERSEEEMLSELGELAHFGGGSTTGGFATGHDTPTTAQESVSLVSGGNHSIGGAQGGPTSSASTAGTDPHIPTHAPLSDRGGVMIHPSGPGSFPSSSSPNISPRADLHRASGRAGTTVADSALAVGNRQDVARPMLGDDDAAEGGDNRPPIGEIVNRVLRPGMINLHHDPHRPGPPPDQVLSEDAIAAAAAARRHPQLPVVVDGFDFDKDAPASPLGSAQWRDRSDSYRDLPADVWSPAGKMNVSPILVARDGQALAIPDGLPAFPSSRDELHVPSGAVSLPGEKTPLLMDDVPPEVLTQRHHSDSRTGDERNGDENNNHHRTRRVSMASIGSMYRSLVSDLRSEEDSSKNEINNESEHYLYSSMLARAFPERMFALVVTLIFEIPVLLMISGGSDALCELVGRSRYQLLMGFIPLTSAISGNVGLQASTLTTRAISHCHVTAESFLPWFIREVGAACYLGLGMGLLLGAIAFYASQMDLAFGVTIMFAQFISIVTAGVTGTFAPLLFSFIFKRDSGKWGGPLETAIQDIVGSFAMVVISYQILKFFGPGPIDPSDTCGAGDADDLS